MNSESQPQQQQSVQTVQISHLQLLINAVVLAYHRNAYTLKEAGTIWKAIEHFTEKGSAMMPQVQKGNEQQQQSPVPVQPSTPATQVSPVTQAGQAKSTETVHQFNLKNQDRKVTWS